MDANAYARQLQRLLPPGILWRLEPTSTLYKTLLAVSDTFARVHGRAATLIEECDPRTAFELLEDWERVLGLPDACLSEIPETVSERRAAITQKYTTKGGQTKQFFIDLAATVGYTVTIDEFKVARSGRMRSGDRCYGTPWAYAWRVNVPAARTGGYLHAGSLAGDYLGPTGGVADIECVINRAAPAHTYVLFAYE
jgi:uncharacterized protein YmfQ (DUF2313 family)